MNKSLALKNKFYLFFLLLISLFLFLYIFYFLINGPRGIFSYYKIINQNKILKDNLNGLDIENTVLLNNINRLKINTVDLDFLDEKIREKTGYLDNNELLILFD